MLSGLKRHAILGYLKQSGWYTLEEHTEKVEPEWRQSACIGSKTVKTCNQNKYITLLNKIQHFITINIYN